MRERKKEERKKERKTVGIIGLPFFSSSSSSSSSFFFFFFYCPSCRLPPLQQQTDLPRPQRAGRAYAAGRGTHAPAAPAAAAPSCAMAAAPPHHVPPPPPPPPHLALLHAACVCVGERASACGRLACRGMATGKAGAAAAGTMAVGVRARTPGAAVRGDHRVTMQS